MHLIRRRYRTDNLDLFHKYISVKWYVDWMPSAKKSIMKCKCVFVYSNGTFPEVYPKEINKIMQVADKLQEFCEYVGIPET